MSRDLIEERWLFLLQQESDCNRQAIQSIIYHASQIFGSSEPLIKSANRARNHSWARKSCYILMKRMLGMKSSSIEKMLRKNKNSVSKALKRLPYTENRHPEFQIKMNRLEEMVRSELKNKIIFLKTEPSNLS